MKQTDINRLGEYDVIVVGAGHAGIEAAHAAAVLGAKTALFTISLDFIGNMPCNPSIGGTAKGHLVRELDALGGLMGIAADRTYLQSRMLNKGKGPAVHSLRVQTDRKQYHLVMKQLVEETPNLYLHQAEITGLDVAEGRVRGVFTHLNGWYGARCVVLATGTSLELVDVDDLIHGVGLHGLLTIAKGSIGDPDFFRHAHRHTAMVKCDLGNGTIGINITLQIGFCHILQGILIGFFFK